MRLIAARIDDLGAAGLMKRKYETGEKLGRGGGKGVNLGGGVTGSLVKSKLAGGLSTIFRHEQLVLNTGDEACKTLYGSRPAYIQVSPCPFDTSYIIY